MAFSFKGYLIDFILDKGRKPVNIKKYEVDR